MRYLPQTKTDIAAMLEAIGVQTLDDLFATLPKECRRKDPVRMPAPMSEWALDRHMDALASTTAVAPEYTLF
ncbi:MAG: glycine dehydrogenase, partial [Desulfosarcinaceae bacterium]